ncbi:MAG: hypothetical protein U0517_00365 [Candidatus Andersenbacteria bacterium]
MPVPITVKGHTYTCTLCTICPEHKERCSEPSACPSWNSKRNQDIQELTRFLKEIHVNRSSSEFDMFLSSLAPIPEIPQREDPALMVAAYTRLVNELMEERIGE